MIIDPGPWLKLWWKGVDIVANLLTGVLLALLALGSWRIQQWWSRRLAHKHAKEDLLHGRRKQIRVWQESRDTFAARFQKNGAPQFKILEEFEGWLRANHLYDWRDNHLIPEDWKRKPYWSSLALTAKNPYANNLDPQNASYIAAEMRKIELPTDEDDSFDWPTKG